MRSKPARPRADPQVASSRAEDGLDAAALAGAGRAGEGEMTFATFGYLGAIFLGPVIPLVIYLAGGRKWPFLRYHASRAVNLSITGLLYALCCLILAGLLLLDSLTVALVVAVPIGLWLWLSVLKYLIRGISAANRGEQYEVPGWICAQVIR
jgi:uncharacterized Tic20 family protein